MTSMTTLRERLKVCQAQVFAAIEHPFVPPAVRVGMADLMLLLVDLVDRIEKLEKEKHP